MSKKIIIIDDDEEVIIKRSETKKRRVSFRDATHEDKRDPNVIICNCGSRFCDVCG